MDRDPAALTSAEFRTLVSLLQRLIETDIDQWARWRFDMEYGPVFVRIDMAAPDDSSSPGLYVDMTEWLAKQS